LRAPLEWILYISARVGQPLEQAKAGKSFFQPSRVVGEVFLISGTRINGVARLMVADHKSVTIMKKN
jgi:hypothetical protein